MEVCNTQKYIMTMGLLTDQPIASSILSES